MKVSLQRALSLAFTFALFVATPIVLRLFGANNAITNYVVAAVLLLLIWRLSRKEGKNLGDLGLNFSLRNMLFLLTGTGLGMLFFSVLFLGQYFQNSLELTFNPNVNVLLLLQGVFVLLAGVLVEEMIFRGYCFKRSVALWGVTIANAVFAFLFIAWHWVAFNAWGNWGQMLALTTTGLGHLLFATALLRSGTLYFPIGIHLGNNWMSRYIFSSRTSGIVDTQHSNDTLFFVTTHQTDFSAAHNALSYSITLVCFLALIAVIWMLLAQRHQSST